MTNLIKFREQQNLTQEELAEKSGLSVRTIQRIEAGTLPKGYTLKVLAKVLGINEEELTQKAPEQNIGQPEATRTDEVDFSENTVEHKFADSLLLKLINISSLPFTLLPPLNVIVPLSIALYKKEKHPIVKQIISVQIIWTIVASIIFMVGVFIRKWFALNNSFITLIMVALILCNFFIIIRNALELSKHRKLSNHFNINVL